jgi:beta-N-acetylhexosaminidase
MEGGRVLRLKAPFTKWPSLAALGKLDSTSVAFRFAQAMGQELRSIGINLDFAPCVDVLTNPKNTVIGDRSLGKDPDLVGRLASALVRGYIKSVIIPCAKHFPGHGNTLLDSHLDLPVEEIDIQRLNEVELSPFKKAIRARLHMLMTAHIRFSKIDPEWPVTLSEKFLKDVLRKEFRYRNIIISDDLDMKALINHYPKEKIAVRALQAGCDILLYCNDPESPKIGYAAVEKAVKDGQISAQTIEESFARITKLKSEALAHPDPLPFSQAIKIIGHPDHVRLAQSIEAGSVPADLLTT